MDKELSDLELIEKMISIGEDHDNLIGFVNAFGVFRATGFETKQAVYWVFNEFDIPNSDMVRE